MAPHHGLDNYGGSERNRNNNNFDWGPLICASPGLALFVIAILIKVCT